MLNNDYIEVCDINDNNFIAKTKIMFLLFFLLFFYEFKLENLE